MNKQLFFSHTWRADRLGRNTHQRVYNLVKMIREQGWTTWFDEEDMGGNIDAAMAEGIDNADAVIVCLTEEYCNKVNETAKDPRKRDNCLKEWTYANARNKLMVPVVMEPCLLNTSEWPPGVVSLYLGSTLYIDASKQDLNDTVKSIIKFLSQVGLSPNKKISIISNPIPLPLSKNTTPVSSLNSSCKSSRRTSPTSTPMRSPALQAIPNIELPAIPNLPRRHSSPTRTIQSTSSRFASLVRSTSFTRSRSSSRTVSPLKARITSILDSVSIKRSLSQNILSKEGVKHTSVSLSDKPELQEREKREKLSRKPILKKSNSTGQIKEITL